MTPTQATRIMAASPSEAARAPAQGQSVGDKTRPAEVESIDVAVCDKSPLILAGLEALINDDRRFRLVLKVMDGEEFLEAARHPRFSVAVIGWQLPTLHARDVLRALSRQAAAPKIVIYSGTNDPAAPAETLQLGGAGFVSKRAPPERLLDVLAAVAAGDMVFPFVDIRKMRADPLENLTLARAEPSCGARLRPDEQPARQGFRRLDQHGQIPPAQSVREARREEPRAGDRAVLGDEARRLADGSGRRRPRVGPADRTRPQNARADRVGGANPYG